MRTRFGSGLAVLASVIATVALSACGGGSSAVATAVMTSDERPSADSSEVPEPDANSDDYCAAAKDAADAGLDATADPEQSLRALEGLAELAPSELADDFETLLGVVDKLAALDGDDLESITDAFEILLDPDLLAASEAIDAYTRQTCGFSVAGSDLDIGGSGDFDIGLDDSDLFDDTTDGEGSTGAEGNADEVDLDDIRAVKEANATASWVDKLTGTFIVSGRDVQVSADYDELSSDEALAACTALIDALSKINPDVAVEVANGETTIVESTQAGTCTPV